MTATNTFSSCPTRAGQELLHLPSWGEAGELDQHGLVLPPQTADDTARCPCAALRTRNAAHAHRKRFADCSPLSQDILI